MIENLILVAAGLIGGFISGLTGIGTGIIMLAVIPPLLNHFGVPDEHHVRVIIANAIFTTLLSSIANILTSIRQRSFYPKETVWIAVAAVIVAFLSFEFIVKSSFYSRTLFNSIIVVYMFIIIVQLFKKLKLSNPRNEHVTKSRLVITGSTAGIVAALTGLGGGTVVIPLLNLWQRVDINKAKTISFGSILAISLWLSINNLFLEPTLNMDGSFGLIVFPIIIPLAAGVLVGSPLGVVTGHKLSGRTVSIVFLVMTSMVTLQKIFELISTN